MRLILRGLTLIAISLSSQVVAEPLKPKVVDSQWYLFYQFQLNKDANLSIPLTPPNPLQGLDNSFYRVSSNTIAGIFSVSTSQVYPYFPYDQRIAFSVLDAGNKVISAGVPGDFGYGYSGVSGPISGQQSCTVCNPYTGYQADAYIGGGMRNDGVPLPYQTLLATPKTFSVSIERDFQGSNTDETAFNNAVVYINSNIRTTVVPTDTTVRNIAVATALRDFFYNYGDAISSLAIVTDPIVTERFRVGDMKAATSIIGAAVGDAFGKTHEGIGNDLVKTFVESITSITSALKEKKSLSAALEAFGTITKLSSVLIDRYIGDPPNNQFTSPTSISYSGIDVDGFDGDALIVINAANNQANFLLNMAATIESFEKYQGAFNAGDFASAAARYSEFQQFNSSMAGAASLTATQVDAVARVAGGIDSSMLQDSRFLGYIDNVVADHIFTAEDISMFGNARKLYDTNDALIIERLNEASNLPLLRADAKPTDLASGLIKFSSGLDSSGGIAAAVPEPASWAMMIIGFGLVGSTMRRRQRAVVRFA